MATLRISVIDRELTIPTSTGGFVERAYDPATRTGSLGSLGGASITADLRAHIIASLGPAAMTALSADDPSRPIVVLLHGFHFDPRAKPPARISESANPHDTVLSFNAVTEDISARTHATPLPLWLGFAGDDAVGSSGLVVCFGWYSVPAGENLWSDYRRAYRLATAAAGSLRVVLDALHAALPTRRIGVMAHSLGSAPIVKACRTLATEGDPAGTLAALDRVLILAGAEYCDVAVDMLLSLDNLGLAKHEGPLFINMASWHDNVLGNAQTYVNAGPHDDSDMIGYCGLRFRDGIDRGRWLDLEIGSQGLSDWLEARGLPRLRRGGYYMGHWEHFTFFENMLVWRDVLRDGRVDWDVSSLRAANIPEYVSKNPWA